MRTVDIYVSDTFPIIASTFLAFQPNVFINNVIGADKLFDVEKITFTNCPKFALAFPEFTGP